MDKNIKRYLIEQDSLIVESISKWICNKYANKVAHNTLWLDKILFIAPTKRSASKFKESIFRNIHKANIKNLAGLNITTLADLIQDLSSGYTTTNSTQVKAIWHKVLDSYIEGDLDNLFPNALPLKEDYSNLIKDLEALKQSLSENLHTIESATEELKDTLDFPRWQDLQKLEERFNAHLKTLSLQTRESALFEAIKNLESFEYDEVVVLANPDISGLGEAFINSFLSDKPNRKVSILIASKNHNLNDFDLYGRPMPSNFSDRQINIENSDIKICANIDEEINLFVDLAKKYKENGNVYNTLALACEQENNATFFERALDKVDIKSLRFTENTLAKTSLYSLLKSISKFRKNPEFKTIFTILSNPYIIKKLELLGIDFEELFLYLDALSQESIAYILSKNTLSKKYPTLNNFLETFLFEKFQIEDFANAINGLFKDNSESLSPKESFAYEAFEEILEDIKQAQKSLDIKFSEDELFEIILDYIKAQKTDEETDVESIALENWIEIFYSEKAHIVLADFNDKIVPMQEAYSKYLSHQTRKILGLRNRELRQARDCYMLEILYTYHKANPAYACTILVPRKNINSEPIFASNLLMMCQDLPQRVNLLFQEPKENIKPYIFQAPWRIKIKEFKIDKEISATKLANYMNSPWNFILENVLKLKTFDINKNELDAMQFGNIAHKIFYNFAKDERIRDSQNPQEIQKYLFKKLDYLVEKEYSTDVSARILMQIYSLKQRLRAFANKQAQHRANGWQILDCEKSLDDFYIGDWKFKGSIDRLDYRGDTLLVIDYKTFDKSSSSIVDKHLKCDKQKNIIWHNFQIPIYVMASKQMYSYKNIESAYFILPKSVGLSRLDFWEDLDDEILESAKENILKQLDKLENMVFDLEELPEYDNYKDIFGLNYPQLKNLIDLQKKS